MTAVATFVLIASAGSFRVSESGLGCGPGGSGTEGWPLCNEEAVPFFHNTEVIVEFSHRTLAAIVTALIVALAWTAYRHLRELRWPLRLTVAAGVLVLVQQAALGGLTVEKSLAEELVAAHLGLAMILIGLMLWISVRARSGSRLAEGQAGAPAAPAGEAGPRRGEARGARSAASSPSPQRRGAAAVRDRGRRLRGRHRGGGHPRAGAEHRRRPHGLRRAVPRLPQPGRLAFGESRLSDIHLTHRVFVYSATLAILLLLTVALLRGSRSRLLIWPARCSPPGAARSAQRLARGARGADRGAPDRRDAALEHRPVDRVQARLGPAAVHGRRGRRAPARGEGGSGLMSVQVKRGGLHGAPPRRLRGTAGANGSPAGAELDGEGQRERVMRAAIATANDYVSLTKPRIISLLLLTTVATMFVADPGGPALSTILWTMLGGYLAAGGAGAINHYIEREKDARMARTRSRPLASGRISPARGLAFGVGLGVAATVQLAVTVNLLTNFPSPSRGCSATSSSTPSG